jgi:ArsR family transcriptional regulator
MKTADPSLEQIFSALADRTRLRLVNLLSQGEICVCFFTAILASPQPTISRHLAYLRRAGLVTARRDGKWIHYRLAGDGGSRVGRVLSSILGELREDAEMRKDVETLQKACCATRLPAAIADAPRPLLHR